MSLKALFKGALLSPLIIIPVFPIAASIEAFVLRQPLPEIRILAAYVVAILYVAYLGMLIFALPMYVILHAIRRHVVLAILVAGFAGYVASLTTIDILLALESPGKAWANFRALFMTPVFVSMWINSLSITGIVVGVTFWWISRPPRSEISFAQHRSGQPSTSI